jgi:ABC-type branched-subunit amino acid transport system ATPase component
LSVTGQATPHNAVLATREAHRPEIPICHRARPDRAELARAVGTYGDLRRLEIARALATRPKLLLLDEPFAGLGSHEIKPLADLIQSLHRTERLTILIIEHKLREFMQLVAEIIAIDFGEVVAVGPPATIVRHPRVVEAYIGNVELDPSTLAGPEGRVGAA